MITTDIMVQFGSKTLAVGLDRLKEPEGEGDYYIIIRELSEPHKDGTPIDKNKILNSQRVCLTFPELEYALNAYAALCRISYHSAKVKWTEANQVIWKVIIDTEEKS